MTTLQRPKGYTGPLNPHPKDGEARIVIYGYVPSEAFGIVAVVVFGLLLIAHIFHLVRWRTTRTFQGLLAFGCLMEFVGYAFRLISHFHPFVVNDFIISYVLVVCAPIFFSASIYIALGDLIKRTGRETFPMSPKMLVGCFVAADVITIITQVGGAALTGSSQAQEAKGTTPKVSPNTANNILLIGLIVQNVCFFIFLTLQGLYIMKLRRLARTTSVVMPPTMLFAALGGSALLVFLRTLYRLAETAEGVFGPLTLSEPDFAGLEFLPVVVALALWAVYPLGHGLRVMDEASGTEKMDGKPVGV